MRKRLKQIIFASPPILILLSFYLLKYPLYISLLFICATYIFTLSEKFDKFEHHKYRQIILWFSGRYIILFLFLSMVYAPMSIVFFIYKPSIIWFKSIEGFLAIVFFSYYFYGYINFKRVTIKKYIVDTFNLEKEIKIAFISDLHLDSFKDRKYLSRRIDLVNEIKADYIFIGGDIFDSYESIVPFDFVKEFQRLNAPTFYIWGNHDYYGHIDKNKNSLLKSNMTLLEDELVYLTEEVVLVGRRDHKSKNRKDIEKLIGEIKKKIIVLDHKPVGVKNIAENKNIKLQLSGHTHGGQIFPVTLLYSYLYYINKGMKKINNTTFIVSQGSGGAFTPFRIGTNNEVVEVIIK